MTLPQFLFLLAMNALVALVISVVVVLTLGRRPESSAPPVVTAPTSTQPTAGASPRPTAGTPLVSNVYVIQSGDSLSGVALKFGVTVDEILRANDLTNPDVLYIGQKLIIPSPSAAATGGPVPPPGTPATAAPTAAPGTPASATPRTIGSPPPTSTPNADPVVKIDLVRKATPGTGDDVAILSNSGGWARLQGWTLVDAQGNAFTFPDLRLFPGGQVRVHTATGKNTEVDLYWGVNRAAWSEGGSVTLKDASGRVIQTYTVP